MTDTPSSLTESFSSMERLSHGWKCSSISAGSKTKPQSNLWNCGNGSFVIGGRKRLSEWWRLREPVYFYSGTVTIKIILESVCVRQHSHRMHVFVFPSVLFTLAICMSHFCCCFFILHSRVTRMMEITADENTNHTEIYFDKPASIVLIAVSIFCSLMSKTIGATIQFYAYIFPEYFGIWRLLSKLYANLNRIHIPQSENLSTILFFGHDMSRAIFGEYRHRFLFRYSFPLDGGVIYTTTKKYNKTKLEIRKPNADVLSFFPSQRV